MKKMFLSAICLAIATSGLLIACQKTNDATSNNSTTTACTDSAYLMPDSLNCGSSYNIFYLIKSRKNIFVSTGTFTDIDTVVNGGSYLINYDSVGRVGLCGVMVTKANLTCHTKL